MKIAFYTDYPPFKERGGAEIRMHKITTMLADRGHEVHVFCGGKEREEKIVEDVHYHIYKNYWEDLPWGIRNMVYVLQNYFRFLTWGNKIEGFDVVDAYRPLLGADVATFAGISINALMTGPIPKKLLVMPLILLNSVFIRTVSRRITTYETTRRTIERFHHVSPRVIYAGIDTQFIQAEKNPENADKFRVLSSKEIEKVCKVAENLDREDILFLALNPGESVNKLPENVKDLGTVSHEKVLELMKTSDAFLQLSPLLSLAQKEAMAVGLPVIARDSELIEDGKDGFVVEDGKTETIADRIRILADDEKLKNKMGKRAEKLVKDFTWENTCEKTLSTYEEIV